MEISRRKLLVGLGIGLGTVCCSSYSYLNDTNIEKPPEIEGKILADLHTHLFKNNKIEDIVELLSWGITGLTVDVNGKRQPLLSYDDVVNLPNSKEIDKGLFAEINFNGKKGYFVKSQEVLSDFHILSLACNKLIPNYKDARKTIEEIHKHNGIAILNHPYFMPKKRWNGYIIIKGNQEKKLKELCEIVDEIEVSNSQLINFIPGIFWVAHLNEKAKELAKQYGHKGTAASDSHNSLEQIKIAGIYVDEKNLNVEALKYYIKNKKFERFEQYPNRLSFIKTYMLNGYL